MWHTLKAGVGHKEQAEGDTIRFYHKEGPDDEAQVTLIRVRQTFTVEGQEPDRWSEAGRAQRRKPSKQTQDSADKTEK